MEGEDGRPAGGSCAMQGHVQDTMWGLNTVLLDRRCIRNFILLKDNRFCFPNTVQISNNKNLNISNCSTLTEKTKHPEEPIQQQRTPSVCVTIVFSNFTKI